MLWNTFTEMDRIRREMDGLFNQFEAKSAGEFPLVNINTSPDAAILTAELPGMCADDIEVTCKEDTVTLRGERKSDKLDEGRRYIRRERGSGRFVRAFTLPFHADSDRVEAQYRAGILSVRVPRAEADKPRKIEVLAN